MVNLAWRMLQQYLLQCGYVRLRVTNYIIPSLPASTNLDTIYQASLSWTGYSDGYAAPYTGIVLPQTLIRPLKLMERVSATSPNTNQFWDMSGPEQGITRIPSIPKTYRNVIWSWDDDQITMPGAVNTLDLRVDYASYLADFTGSGEDFPGDQVVPILNCEDAFSGFIAYIFSQGRGDMDSGAALASARDAAAIIAGKNPPSETVQAVQ